MAELKALSKLKMAGKLHYWRGTIEIDEYELHTICDEIQAEHDKAIATIWDGLRKFWNIELTEEGVRLRDAAHGTLTAEQVRGVLLLNLPHREYYSIEQTDAWQAIADELNRRAERTCRIAEGRMSESNYEKLFGTPERAAWTLAKACGECDEDLPCYECPLYPIVGNNVYEPEILEWLRGGGKVIDEEDVDLLHCSNCGGAAEKQSWAYWHYCPNCSSKVASVQDDGDSYIEE